MRAGVLGCLVRLPSHDATGCGPRLLLCRVHVFVAVTSCWHPQENRTLREQNFELQSKSRADQNALKRIQAEFADKDKQLRIVVDQHAELLRWVG
jgi:hypothetical protein